MIPGGRSAPSILALLVALVMVPGATAQLTCGTVVAPGQKITLTGDVGPCDGGPAITVESATLDLGGFTVSCADTNEDGIVPDGIVLTGVKARLRSGTVRGCEDGVFLSGSGKHIVQGVRVTGGVEDGIDMRFDTGKNRIVANTIIGNGGDGIEVPSDRNKIQDNQLETNGGAGIDFTSGAVNGVPYSAEKNKVVGNRCLANVDDGIDVGGNNNLIKLNNILGNRESGIDVHGDGNRVVHNSAVGHPEGDIVAAEPCGMNTFRKNSFVTKSGDCVR